MGGCRFTLYRVISGHSQEVSTVKDLYILSLHLAYGGLQKAVAEFANLMAEHYQVHILSFYDMPLGPAYPIDSRVQIHYLYDDVPNREEFREALAGRKLPSVIREGLRATRTLLAKRLRIIQAIRNISSGIIVGTRDEYAVMLSRYGRKNVIKIAQFHEDHAYKKNLVRHFANDYGNIDLFVLLSPKMVKEVKEIMKENHHTRVVYIPNFIREIPAEAPPEKKQRIVIAAGRLHPVKGFDRLIESFAALHSSFPEWSLKIVGDGEEYQTLQDRIAACGAEEYVVLAGRYTAEEIEAAMAEASVYALSSYSEGFPFVLMEAMAGSLPIVAYETRGGLGMMVKDGETGFLVDSKEQFEEKLALLMRDDELRAAMGRASRAELQAFTVEAVGGQWVELIEELCHDKEN
jgi:glycosyltransferase involved in cell wall biosynthesis